MAEAAPSLILYPVFAMCLFVTVVLLRMRSMRFAAASLVSDALSP